VAVLEQLALVHHLLDHRPHPVAPLDVAVEVDVPCEDVGEGDGDVGALTGGLGGVPHVTLDDELHQLDALLALELPANRHVAVAGAADLPLVEQVPPVVEQVELAVAKDEAELVSGAGLPEVELGGLERPLQRADGGAVEAGRVERLDDRLSLGEPTGAHLEVAVELLDGCLRKETRQEGRGEHRSAHCRAAGGAPLVSLLVIGLVLAPQRPVLPPGSVGDGQPLFELVQAHLGGLGPLGARTLALRQKGVLGLPTADHQPGLRQRRRRRQVEGGLEISLVGHHECHDDIAEKPAVEIVSEPEARQSGVLLAEHEPELERAAVALGGEGESTGAAVQRAAQLARQVVEVAHGHEQRH